MSGATAVVITTIYDPSLAVKDLAARAKRLIVIGDRKTPRDWSCCPAVYYSLDDQKSSRFSLQPLLPQNHYCRKMLGYLYASDADCIIDTDDDNIPLAQWGFPPFAGMYDLVTQQTGWVNVYSHYTDLHIWPRGLPLDCVKDVRCVIDDASLRASEERVGIWQGLADGDPDVDAIYRLTDNRNCFFKQKPPIVLDEGVWSPFNSQNTAFSKPTFPLLYLPATVTFRFTDILRGIVAQPILWAAGLKLGFTAATVRQERNPHDYTKDFISEIPCFTQVRRASEIAQASVSRQRSIVENLSEVYRALAKEGVVDDREQAILCAWLDDIAASAVK